MRRQPSLYIAYPFFSPLPINMELSNMLISEPEVYSGSDTVMVFVRAEGSFFCSTQRFNQSAYSFTKRASSRQLHASGPPLPHRRRPATALQPRAAKRTRDKEMRLPDRLMHVDTTVSIVIAQKQPKTLGIARNYICHRITIKYLFI